MKPGENTNRGCGITVCKDLAAVKDVIATPLRTLGDGRKRSYIVQRYLDRPLLFFRRKFDIRAWTLLTAINGNLQGYWYRDGYIRTCSREFSLKNTQNKFIHLTNDAI